MTATAIDQVLNGDDSEFLKAIAPKYEEKNMKILATCRTPLTV